MGEPYLWYAAYLGWQKGFCRGDQIKDFLGGGGGEIFLDYLDGPM